MNVPDEEKPGDGVEKFAVSLRDVCLSNSWAVQAILEYLEEERPGARDRIWRKYLQLKQLSEEAGGES